MIHRIHLTYLCASMMLLFQTVSGISFEIPLKPVEVEESCYFNTMKEIQIQTDEIASIYFEKRTFENTLKAWNQLGYKVAETSRALSSIGNPMLIHDWNVFVDMTVFQNRDLNRALIAYANCPPDHEALNPYQLRSLDLFLSKVHQDDSPTYTHLKGLIEDNDFSGERLTILNLSAKSKGELSLEHLVEKILAEDPDVVCIQDITEDGSSYELYDFLKRHYAHFFMTIDIRGLTSALLPNKSLLIASKCSMENPEFVPLSENKDNGYVHFILKSGATLLGHAYAVQSESNQKEIVQVEQILAAMESQYREDIPFILCCNLKEPESKELFEAYFSFGTGCAFLNTFLLNAPASKDINYQIETSILSMSENHQAVFSSIKKSVKHDHSSSHLTVRSPRKISKSNASYIILCEANEGNDNNRNESESKEGNDRAGEECSRLEITLGTENNHQGERLFGSLNVTTPGGSKTTLSGELSTDKDGNLSHKAQLELSIPLGRN